MSPAEVIQVLQALKIKTMGMSQAEKKQELRAQTGLPRKSIIRAEGSGTRGGGKRVGVRIVGLESRAPLS